jgi:phosphate transport system protein
MQQRRRLSREVDKLKRQILSLSAEVEKMVRLAVACVSERDAETARMVEELDFQIDQAEVDLEEEVLKLLALYQPVAVDLRFIVAVLKINNDLERIGDLAVNIALRAAMLASLPDGEVPFDFPAMAARSQWMLRSALDALVNLDTQLAFDVCDADDEVDAINHQMYETVIAGLKADARLADRWILLLGISRLLERIADHATNIAEDVIYLTTGEIVRHRAFEEYQHTSVDG